MTKPFALANQAAAGFADASKYDQNRPSYPADAVNKLLAHLGVAGLENGHILDLAAGTGKFTELVAARPEHFEVIAVEPHPVMRETLLKKSLGSNIKVLDGDAGRIPTEECWADALVAAQAFHWFATEESLKEIHRVLRPGAALGLIWNIEDYNAPTAWASTTKWENILKDILRSIEDGHPRFRHLTWKEVFENHQDQVAAHTVKHPVDSSFPLFSLPIGEEVVKWKVWLTDAALWDRYSTLSQIANLEGEMRVKVRKEFFDALKTDDVERNEEGEVEVHGITYLAWTSRT